MNGDPRLPGEGGGALAETSPDQTLTRATLLLDEVSGATRAMSPADEALDRFRELAVEWQPDIRAYRAAKARRQAAEAELLRVQNDPAAAQAAMTNWDRAMPHFAAAAAMMDPRVVGRPLASIPQSLLAYGDTYNKSMEAYRTRMAERAKLEYDMASKEEAGQRSEFTLARQAVGTLAQLERAKQVGSSTGKRFVNVPNVGLVDTHTLDEDGKPRVVLGSDNIPKLKMEAERLAKQRADKRTFASSPDRAAWERAEVERIMGTVGQVPTLPTAGPAGGPPQAPAPAALGAPGPVVEPPRVPAVPPGAVAPPPGAPPAAAAPTPPPSPYAAYIQAEPPKPRVAMRDPVAEKIAEAGGKEAAKNAEETYTKDVVPAANTAEELLDEVTRWRSVRTPTGRLAAWKESAGGWMDALGIDNKVVREAKDLQKLNEILMRRTQRGLALQKGVQTEGDAQREQTAGAQIANTLDANDFILRNVASTSLRIKEKQRFFDEFRERRGNLVGSDAAWRKYVDDTPRTASIDGRLVFVNEFFDRVQQANPGATRDQIMEAWRERSKR